MFLGTARRWWVAAILLLVLGLALAATGGSDTLRVAVGVLLFIAGMAVFAAAPMRYGQSARKATTERASPSAPLAAAEQPRPRANIEARDATEV